MHDYDLIVVGARVAGSVTASLVADAGHRVLLLDRAHFPSDTLSTHFFRAPALRAFARIGIYDQVQSCAPHMVLNHNVVDGIVFAEAVDRPPDYPFYMCVRRITLDEILVRRSRNTPQVELREGAKVKRLIRKKGRVSGIAWDEAGGTCEATARAVVGADGLRSFIAREVVPQIEQEEPVRRAMYYAYFQGVQHVPGPAAEFHYLGDELAYCFPCDADLAMLAVSVPIERFKEFKRAPERTFMAQLEAMKDLQPRLRKAERVSKILGTGSIPGYLRVPWGDGWALVGDAGMVMDPWSGQGIDQASTHGVILSHHLDRYLSEKVDWVTAMQAYHLERNEFSQKAFHRTCTFSRDLRQMTRAALARRGLA